MDSNTIIVGEKDTCIPLLIAALFTIARTWKQPRCPQTDEWIKKLWYIYTMEYYSAIKKDQFESVVVKWMNLESLIQNEVRKIKTSIIYQHIHMESRKIVLLNLVQNRLMENKLLTFIF